LTREPETSFGVYETILNIFHRIRFFFGYKVEASPYLNTKRIKSKSRKNNRRQNGDNWRQRM